MRQNLFLKKILLCDKIFERKQEGRRTVLYNNLSSYLREKYGKRMKKICIDGGFSCPNRDGKCGTGGCIFCGERGAGEHIDPTLSITEQVNAALSKAGDDDIFIAYFQNFSNTYAPTEELKRRYDAALFDSRIKIFAVGTRADCIDEQICKLLASYSNEREVWVELGLQTANDGTAKIINRGYDRKVFDNAMALLSRYSIKVVVHTMIGLPGEDIRDVIATCEYISKFKPFGVKIHSVYVMKSTRLGDMYEKKLYTPPTLSEFTDAAVYMLTHLPPDTVIHRLTGDCPRDSLLAPEWNKDKNNILAEIRRKMEEEKLSQGCLFK